MEDIKEQKGCCSSPALFKMYIQQLQTEWSWKRKKMRRQIQEEFLHTLQFTDEQLVIATDKYDTKTNNRT